MPDKDELHARIDHDFTNWAPGGDDIIRRFEQIREAGKQFAHTVVDLTPTNREQSLALTHIEQGLMHAVSSVARHQEDV